MPYAETLTASQINQKATAIRNLTLTLEAEWLAFYEVIEQIYADAAIGNSTNTTFEAHYGMPANWASRLRSLAAHALELQDFLDNAAVSTADRRFDLNWFSG